MDLTPYVAALRDDLAAAASVGDEATARAGTSLAGALEPAVRLALMNALSDLAAEVSEALPDRSVDLRLRGREVNVVVTRDADAPPDGGFFAGPSSSPFVGAGRDGGGAGGPQGPPPPPPHGVGPDVGDVSRMTLRIVDQIKGQAERAAASQGMSLNSWVAQAVQGALRGQGGWPGGGSDGRPGRDGWPGTGWPGRDGWPGRGGWPGRDSWSDRGSRDEGPPDGGGPSATDQGSRDRQAGDRGPTRPDGEGRSDEQGRSDDKGRGDDDGSGGVDGWVRG